MRIWVKLKWNKWLKSLKNVKKWNYLFVFFFRQNKQSDANHWECLFWLSHVKKLREFASKRLFRAQFQRHAPQIHGKNLIKLIFTAENAFSSKDAHFSAIRSKNQSGNPTEKERYTSQSWEWACMHKPLTWPERVRHGSNFLLSFSFRLWLAQKCVHAFTKIEARVQAIFLTIY